ncbi:MAG: ATPase [Gammaproteobacteria bacterium]|nr:ATPase [Gammaproteobacteria bacterium]MDE2139085.1 ATPase [Gammaproteobacteria bacterium]
MNQISLTGTDTVTTTNATHALPWRLLRLLNVYHLLVAVLIIAVSATGSAALLGTLNPGLFLWTGIAYLVYALLTALSLYKRWPGYALQAQIQLMVDTIAVVILMHASGGPVSGLGVLLFVSIVANTVLMPWRVGMGYAAVATVLILADNTYLVLHGPATEAGYVQGALTGVVLFVAAISGAYLGRRLRESEALAVQRGVDLQNLAQLNEYIIHHMRTGVLVVDETGRVRLANEAALANFPRRSGLENRLSDLSPQLQQEIESWRTGGQERPKSFTTEDGKPVIPYFTRLAPARDAGTLIFLEDASEITERVRQMKLAALGRLTGSIAHEIRNPLAAISHANQLLAESAKLQSDDRRLTEIIAEHAKRMENMVETILQLSRREATRTQELELEHWLRDFVAEFRERHGLDGQALAVRIDSGDEVRVRVDPGHLYQIAWNLSENALRYGRPAKSFGGPLIEYRISPLNSPDSTEFAIMDRGRGVPKDIAEHIFEPFYTSSPRGTGLGLFIARELCECNHARLVYEQRPEGGSCFRILFGPQQGWLA